MCIRDRQTGKTYEGLGYFEDTLDAGNEYIYFCPKGNPAIVTKGTKAEIKLVENTDFAASVEAVSYTHLDVYKRQLRSSSALPAAAKTS